MIKSRRLRWGDHVARMEEDRSTFKILTDTPAGRRHLGRSRRRWEDSIRMNIKEIAVNMRNWVDLAPDMEPWDSISHGVSYIFWHITVST